MNTKHVTQDDLGVINQFKTEYPEFAYAEYEGVKFHIDTIFIQNSRQDSKITIRYKSNYHSFYREIDVDKKFCGCRYKNKGKMEVDVKEIFVTNDVNSWKLIRQIA